jgi:hypothetical protein
MSVRTARAVIYLELAELGEQILRAAQQMAEEVIEIGIAPEIPVEVVEVEEDRCGADLRGLFAPY